MRLRVMVAGVIVASLGLAVGCGTPESTTAHAPTGRAGGPSLINDEWRILKMATAHGVFTIEVELRDLETAAAVARALVEPLTSDYTEVLVYIYPDGHGAGGYVPAKRIQWTAAGGLVEIDY